MTREYDLGDAISPLIGLDACIQNTIENFGLDGAELTDLQKIDLINRSDMLYDVMIHVRNSIQDALKNVQPFVDGIE